MPTFDVRVPEEPFGVLVIGAHMDDCEIKFGGTAARFREAGHDVHFVSMTNGEAGHHEQSGRQIARRRRREFESSASVIGAETTVFDVHEGELRPTVERRNDVIRLFREYEPELVLTHRPNDYHPDHRYTEQIVRDSAYMVTVPNICAHTDHLQYNPVIAYLHDDFQKPTPFEADVVTPIDDVVDTKLEMLHRHESQMYEWLPYNLNKLDEVPEGEDARREYLREQRLPENEAVADRFRDVLTEQYGPAGEEVQYAEAVEHCEYGGRLTDENRDVLFPWLDEEA
jgi:LmbE family N-acetylglucosaminyl deacetylase